MTIRRLPGVDADLGDTGRDDAGHGGGAPTTLALQRLAGAQASLALQRSAADHAILALQRSAGNHAVAELVARGRPAPDARLARMPYGTAIQSLSTSPRATSLAQALAAKFGGAAAPPDVNITVDAALAPAAVSAHVNLAANKIELRRGSTATDEAVLDGLLFEVNNALNPQLAQAQGLPKSTAVGRVGAATSAAEYMTYKAYVLDLMTQLAGGNMANLPTLIGTLPPEANRAITAWVNTYQPLYAGFGVPPAAMLQPVPVNNLLPLPAVAPVPPGTPLQAEQAAVMQFSGSVHNPGATGGQFYLSLLWSREVYAYERVRAWDPNQLANYVGAIPGLRATLNLGANTPLTGNATYKRYRDPWFNISNVPQIRPYLFVCMCNDLAANHGVAFPADFELAGPRHLATSRQEAARWIASVWAGVPQNLKPLIPLKPILQSDAALRAAVLVEIATLTNAPAPASLNLNLIK